MIKMVKRTVVNIGIVVLFFLVSVQSLNAQSSDAISNQIKKFAQSLYYVNSLYIDTVNNQKLTDKAIANMIMQLDPHSMYISAEDVKAMNEPLEGNFEGVGIEFAIVRDTLNVMNTISGGPSERVGIRAGDKIVAIDGKNIASIGLKNEQVLKFLRGNKGTKVEIRIVRKNVSQKDGYLDFIVVRDKIPINSLDAMFQIKPGVLYIKLSRFATNSYQEILDKISKINLASVNGVILDLRGNAGGLLSTAFDVANIFLNRGQTIVYTEGRRMKRVDQKADGYGFYKQGALAVLIDENSASASEIVAGAIQDWDRGAIIGRRSFGKGLVQQMLPLEDGSQLRLTVARYHTPSGRVIQSHYEEGKISEYYKALFERYKNGEYFSKDSIHFPDSLKYKTLIKGRTVYGGGGIMPDYFVPADTTWYSKYYGTLVNKNILLDYINDINEKNREVWKGQYKSFEQFNQDFVVDQVLLDNLLIYAEKQGVAPDREGLDRSKSQVNSIIKAAIARFLFGSDAYYKVLVTPEDDPTIAKALEVII